MTELKHKNAIIYELLQKYDKNETKCEPNIEKVHKEMIELIKSKCINILQLISGQHISEDDTQIADKLSLALNELNSELNEVEKLNNKFRLNFQKYQTVGLYYKLSFVLFPYLKH